MSEPNKQGPPEGKENAESIRENGDSDQNLSKKRDFSTEQKDFIAEKAKSSSENQEGLIKFELEISRELKHSLSARIDQQRFVLKKSEFLKTSSDYSIHDFKPLISNFLNDTKLSDDYKLSIAELKELSKNREGLSSAQNLQEAVEHALQLTRFYRHLQYIEEEKKVRDLLLGLDPQDQLGKEIFKELERMHPADIAQAPANQVANGINLLSKHALRKRITNLSGGKVIVLGDLLIDELIEGKPDRISREAPVLILEHVITELILGGAANTASNLAALGGQCHAIGICGRDEYAKKLARLFEKSGITCALVEDAARPTTVKTRILSSAHALRQQLLRLDRISHEKICSEIANRVLEKFRSVADKYSAVIISDYRSGLITDELVSSCLQIAAEKNLKVIVDAQNDFARFKNTALITPNQPDAEAAIGFPIDSHESLKLAGKTMLELSGAKAVLLTRGGEGMVLFQTDAEMFELPAFNRSEVFDVTGAGDTVVATMTLAMVTGASMQEAMALGNLAAGLVVKKPGTDVTSQKEMLEALELLKIKE